MTTYTGYGQPPCGFCGNYHGPTCPLIKSIEYYPDGTIKRIEYARAEPEQKATDAAAGER